MKVKLPPGVKVTRQALNDVYLHWVETGDLPPNVEISGIFWRNTARKGKLKDWRQAVGSDVSKKPRGPMQPATPGDDFENARLTLRGALRRFRPF